jgi:hypothetical protein
VFVSLGLGSVIAASVERVPWLIAISRHKGTVFIGVGLLLTLNYWLAIVRPRRRPCEPGEICHVDSPAMRVNRLMFWTSVAIYTGAAILAYATLWWVRMQS